MIKRLAFEETSSYLSVVYSRQYNDDNSNHTGIRIIAIITMVTAIMVSSSSSSDCVAFRNLMIRVLIFSNRHFI